MLVRSALALAVGLVALSMSKGFAAPAQAPNARLAGLIGISEGGSLVHISRRKNIQGVTRPAAGVFCIVPSSTAGLSLSAILPVVTAVKSNIGTIATAFLDPTNTHCAINAIEVQTYNFHPGTDFYIRTDAYFTIIVP